MLARKGFIRQQAAYPTLAPAWLANGRRIKAGLPPLPLPVVEGVKKKRRKGQEARLESQIIVELGEVPDGEETDGG
jgi:hypothetical protein